MTTHSLVAPRLLRVRDGYIAGVAGGLARRLGVSSVVVRLLWLAAVLFFGTGLLLYLVMWWVVPHEDRQPLEPTVWVRGRDGRHPPLVRTSVDRKLLGVCGGIARRWGWDPSLVRLSILSLASLSFGVIAVGYLLAAILLPSGEAPLTERHVVDL